MGKFGMQYRRSTNALKPASYASHARGTHLHILNHKVNIDAALGGGSVVPLSEERSGRSPAKSPVLASY
jgi:hypothetical protein